MVSLNFVCLVPFFLVLVTRIRSEYRRYDGYKVLQVIPQTEDDLNALRQIQLDTYDLKSSGDVRFLKESNKIGRSVDILIDPGTESALQDRLKQSGLKANVVVKNIQKLVDQDYEHISKNEISLFKKGSDLNKFDLFTYHSHEEINNYLDAIADKYKSIAELIDMGKSHEGREMQILKIGIPGGSKKKGFWLDAGIHAREWITEATALYIIDQLITGYDKNESKIVDYLKAVDFYILPCANPDGYEYTRNKDRMWRKTRSGPRKGCYGTDPNRNWPMKWNTAGASNNPCSEVYAGPKAWSEIECKQMGAFLDDNKEKLHSYISLHSYSELWLYSYGYKSHTYPPDVDELKALAEKGAEALKAVHGVRYTIGSPTDILYAASGGSDDWAKSIGIKWTYTLELRPGQLSWTGFLLPAKQIKPTGEETWAGLQVVIKKMIE